VNGVIKSLIYGSSKSGVDRYSGEYQSCNPRATKANKEDIMKKLIKMALRYRYGKCTWKEFTDLIKLTLAQQGKKTSEVVVRQVAFRAMQSAKQIIGG
jgi:hypothetical protein